MYIYTHTYRWNNNKLMDHLVSPLLKSCRPAGVGGNGTPPLNRLLWLVLCILQQSPCSPERGRYEEQPEIGAKRTSCGLEWLQAALWKGSILKGWEHHTALFPVCVLGRENEEGRGERDCSELLSERRDCVFILLVGHSEIVSKPSTDWQVLTVTCHSSTTNLSVLSQMFS